MNSRRRTLAGTLAIGIVLLVLLPPLSIVVNSWYSRLEASRLLARAKYIRPGLTSEADTRRALAEFDRYLTHGQQSIMGKPPVSRDSYWISNYPNWVRELPPHLPMWLNQKIWFLPYSSFSVSPRFENGQLALLEIREVQDHKGDIHPFAAIVRVLSTRNEQSAPELPDSFTGFHVSPIEEAAFGEDEKQIGPSWVSREYVTLDERASLEQIARSFDFQLGYLTSFYGCHDARQLLPIVDDSTVIRFHS